MKKNHVLLSMLLFAAMGVGLQAQSVRVDYMKVDWGNQGLYEEVEQEWKKLHQKKADAGIITGWQLWRKLYSAGDPYQYMTINWYKDMEHSFEEGPEGFWESAMEGIDEEMMNKTLESRTMVKTMMSHTLASTENNKPARYIVVNSMKPHEGKWNDYVAFERDVIKPLFEARIEQGALASWGLWQTYPYEQDDVRLVTVDGFESAEQMFMNWNFRENFEAVHPDRDWNESYQEMSQLRTMESVEIWELVDSVWPEH